MIARQIDTKTPNQTVAQPATVRACERDRGNPQDQAARADWAVGQWESTRFHAKESAEAAGGFR
ncbi:hypothetical protein [Streptomyces sp. NBC_00519]|uniref:hypothetical protein n=1 Tax=Streptomyces sp. NBC_00519 TaxID=2975764 RepID=UPI0030E0B3A0